MWTVSFIVPEAAVTAFALALDDIAVSVSQFEDTTSAGRAWRIDALFEQEPNRADLISRLALVERHANATTANLQITQVPDTDWVAATLSSFNPMHIGRFWVHGGHHRGSAPPGTLPLQIDASTAFGTGEHATTYGCLMAIDDLAKRNRFRRTVMLAGGTPILDVGCGTGILAMAAARRWPVNALASDIDKEAVRVARAIVLANGLANRVTVVQADGITQRHIMTESPYALITANILARPLCRMAKDFAAALAPRGRIILSGLLNNQVSMVRSAYQVCGLTMERRISVGEWAALILKR